MKTREEMWLEFSRLHPLQWECYEGGCNCPSCSTYRFEFKEWLEKNRPHEAKGAK